MAQLAASDSLDEFYQVQNNDENHYDTNNTSNGNSNSKNNKNITDNHTNNTNNTNPDGSIGYRGFTTFGKSSPAKPNFNNSGTYSNGSLPSPSGSDTLTSEVRHRGDVKIPQNVNNDNENDNDNNTSPYRAKFTNNVRNNSNSADDDNGPVIPPRQNRAQQEVDRHVKRRGSGKKQQPQQLEHEHEHEQEHEHEHDQQFYDDANPNITYQDEHDYLPPPEQQQQEDQDQAEWKHKNTRDMNDLWTSPPRNTKSKKDKGMEKLNKINNNINTAPLQVSLNPREGRGATAPNTDPNQRTNEHWSHNIDEEYDEDNKLDLLKQRMASRQQQRTSKSAGTNGNRRNPHSSNVAHSQSHHDMQSGE